MGMAEWSAWPKGARQMPKKTRWIIAAILAVILFGVNVASIALEPEQWGLVGARWGYIVLILFGVTVGCVLGAWAMGWLFELRDMALRLLFRRRSKTADGSGAGGRQCT